MTGWRWGETYRRLDVGTVDLGIALEGVGRGEGKTFDCVWKGGGRVRKTVEEENLKTHY